MTPAEQRVLDAARAYRDARGLPGQWPGLAEGRRLLEAARALPHTWPPPTATDNPAEVVLGEVRWDGEAYRVSHFGPDGLVALRWTDCTPGRPIHGPQVIADDRLVSRPGVDL